MTSTKSTLSTIGFTLVELLVVVGMLSVLMSIAFIAINPMEQLKKAEDSTRKHDLEEIRNALDLYYNDKGCYPVAIPFGLEWKSGISVLMKKIPQDPLCKRGSCYSYLYQTDTSSNCPQWNVLYSKLESKAANDAASVQCRLDSLCTDLDKTPGDYNHCITSGPINCDYIAGYAFPVIGSPASSTTTTLPASTTTTTTLPASTTTTTTLPASTTTTTLPCQYCSTCFYGLRDQGYGNLACNNVGSDNPKFCNTACSIPCCQTL